MATIMTEKPTAKKTTAGKKPMTFRQILAKVKKDPSALKTAVSNGWLSGDGFATKVRNDKEQDAVLEAYREDEESRKATAKVLNLPRNEQTRLADVKFTMNKVKVTVGERTVTVDRSLFESMKKRHEDADVYMYDKDVVFSGKEIVAVLSGV